MDGSSDRMLRKRVHYLCTAALPSLVASRLVLGAAFGLLLRMLGMFGMLRVMLARFVLGAGAGRRAG